MHASERNAAQTWGLVDGHRDPEESDANWLNSRWSRYRCQPDTTTENERAQVAA